VYQVFRLIEEESVAGRYRARIVLNDKYYRQVIAYVHLNPVAAGLTSDPADWIWSGHGALIGIREPVLVNPEEALVGFDADILGSSRKCLGRDRWSPGSGPLAAGDGVGVGI
jgi:hypothetical protein